MDLNVPSESSAVYQRSFTTARFSLLKILPWLQAIAVSRGDLLLFTLLLILSDLLRQLPQGLIQVPWMRSGEAANQKTINQVNNKKPNQNHCIAKSLQLRPDKKNKGNVQMIYTWYMNLLFKAWLISRRVRLIVLHCFGLYLPSLKQIVCTCFFYLSFIYLCTFKLLLWHLFKGHSGTSCSPTGCQFHRKKPSSKSTGWRSDCTGKKTRASFHRNSMFLRLTTLDTVHGCVMFKKSIISQRWEKHMEIAALHLLLSEPFRHLLNFCCNGFLTSATVLPTKQTKHAYDFLSHQWKTASVPLNYKFWKTACKESTQSCSLPSICRSSFRSTSTSTWACSVFSRCFSILSTFCFADFWSSAMCRSKYLMRSPRLESKLLMSWHSIKEYINECNQSVGFSCCQCNCPWK